MSRLRSLESIRAVADAMDLTLYRIDAPANARAPYMVATFVGSTFGGDAPSTGGKARVFNWDIVVQERGAEAADALADRVETRLAKRGFLTQRTGEAEVTEYLASTTIDASIFI